MKLYSKKLKGVDDLELEMRRLRLEKKLLEEEKIISKETILGKSEKGEIPPNLIPIALSMSGPVVRILAGIVRDRLSNRKQARQASSGDDGVPAKKKEYKFLKSVAREFIGSYLKWKAVELSYKGLKLIVKKQKKKKEKRAAEAKAAKV